MFSHNYLTYTKCVQRHCLGMDTLNTLLQMYKVSLIPSNFLATHCVLSCPIEESTKMKSFLSDVTRRKGAQRKLANKNLKTSNKKSLSANSSAMLKQISDTKTVLNSDRIESVAQTTLSNFKSLTKRCGVASRAGDLVAVRDLSECASKNYPMEFGQHLSFTYYLAIAEFQAGQQPQALDRMASILHLPRSPDGSLQCESAHSKLQYSFERNFTRAQWKKLRDTTCLLLMDVPNIDDPSLWDQADTLVRSLSLHRTFDKPAYVLWKAYFFSHLHPELERSDGLLERHPAARRLLCEKLKDIVQLLLTEPGTDKVVHLLQQLLKYRLTMALPPITSLLLSMHCQDGSSISAIETFRFAYKLRIPLTSAVLVQFQHLLHQSRTPMPEELIKLKYSVSTPKPDDIKPFSWEF